MIKNFLLITLCIFISGCAKMNAQFDCPMKGGLSCASLDEVNAKVDRGEIATLDAISFHSAKVHPPYLQTHTIVKRSSMQTPKRLGEKVQHIWIAPFEDTAGNYHGESHVYTVIKPGAWTGYPVHDLHSEE